MTHFQIIVGVCVFLLYVTKTICHVIILCICSSESTHACKYEITCMCGCNYFEFTQVQNSEEPRLRKAQLMSSRSTSLFIVSFSFFQIILTFFPSVPIFVIPLWWLELQANIGSLLLNRKRNATLFQIQSCDFLKSISCFTVHSFIHLVPRTYIHVHPYSL